MITHHTVSVHDIDTILDNPLLIARSEVENKELYLDIKNNAFVLKVGGVVIWRGEDKIMATSVYNATTSKINELFKL